MTTYVTDSEDYDQIHMIQQNHSWIGNMATENSEPALSFPFLTSDT